MEKHDKDELTMSAWTKPVLTILVRSNPEESVLTGCKAVTSSGPRDDYAACQMRTQEGCMTCQIPGNS